MRKTFLAIMLIFGTLLLSGCTIKDSKIEKISCSRTGYSSGISYDETQNMSFQSKSIIEYKLILKFDLSSVASNKTRFDEAVEELRKEYSKAIERGVKTDVYPDGDKVVTMFTINLELFDGILNYNNYDLRNVFNSKITAQDLKPEMEKQGYSCTIES